jgi:hypothetical protein
MNQPCRGRWRNFHTPEQLQAGWPRIPSPAGRRRPAIGRPEGRPSFRTGYGHGRECKPAFVPSPRVRGEGQDEGRSQVWPGWSPAPREIPIDILVGRAHDPITLCVQESRAPEVVAQFPLTPPSPRKRSEGIPGRDASRASSGLSPYSDRISINSPTFP